MKGLLNAKLLKMYVLFKKADDRIGGLGIIEPWDHQGLKTAHWLAGSEKFLDGRPTVVK